MLNSQDKLRFEQQVLPHLDAAFNLAAWLLRSPEDAEDAVQEALLRSYQSFPPFHGTAARGWLLRIVHNCCYARLQKNYPVECPSEFEEDLRSAAGPTSQTPGSSIEDTEHLARALESLSPRFRELIVLRELEGCSYKEIATIMSIPTGTVMHSLHHARCRLQSTLMRITRTRPL